MDEMIKYLKALVYIQANGLSDPEARVKPELLLAKAGLKHAEIGDILGKKGTAVAKAISRAK